MKAILRAAMFAMLRLFYRLCSYLPLREQVLFTSFPDFSDNSYALFLHVREAEPGLPTLWLAGAGSALPHPVPPGTRVLRRESIAGIIAVARSRFVCHTHGIYRFARIRPGQQFINLWHGMPLKTIGTYDANVSRLPLGTLAIATSDLFAGIIARAFAMDRAQVLVSGQPRNDLIVREARVREPDVALWMPTYRSSIRGELRDDSPLNPAAMIALIERLDAALRDNGRRLVLKLHPMDALNRELTRSFDAIEVLRHDMTQDSLPVLMARSTCLLTDYSSAAIDFAVLGRPIGYYCPDRDAYSRGFIPEAEEAFFAAGRMLETPQDVVAFLANPAGAPAEALDRVAAQRDDRAATRIWNHLRGHPAGAPDA